MRAQQSVGDRSSSTDRSFRVPDRAELIGVIAAEYFSESENSSEAQARRTFEWLRRTPENVWVILGKQRSQSGHFEARPLLSPG